MSNSSILSIDITISGATTTVRVDLGVMAMKGYYALPHAPALLEPHDQIVLCHIQDIRFVSYP